MAEMTPLTKSDYCVVVTRKWPVSEMVWMFPFLLVLFFVGRAMFCQHCGTSCGTDANYCVNCGQGKRKLFK